MQIRLTIKEKKALHRIHRSLRDGKSRDRIKAILLLSEGYKSIEISRILLIDNDTVTNWSKAFVERKDINSWFETSYKAYDGKLTKEEEKSLIEFIENNFVINSKQAIEYLRINFHKPYSMSGMVNLLHNLGFVYKQSTLIPSKYDPESQKEFKEEYEALEKEIKEDEAIVFMDGVHPQHNTTTSRVWVKKGKEKQVKSNTGRSRININGIYNPSTQEVLVHESERINADTTIEFFKEIEDYYKEKKKIYIIVDNARYYKNKKVKEYTSNSRVELIFLPPYSPNLNLIERLWKLLRREVINNHYYEKFKEFRDAVLGFFENSEQMKNEIGQFIGNKLHLLTAI